MNTVAEKQQVAVIGGGMAGLSAALNLSMKGISVTLFEKSAHSGGRAQTTVKDGYHINFGPHALYLGGAGLPFLKELGLSPAGNPPAQGRALAFYKGKTVELPTSLQSILRTKLLGWTDKLRLIKIFGSLQTLDATPYLSMTVNEWIESYEGLQGAGEALKGYMRTMIQLSTYCGEAGKLSAYSAIEQLKIAVNPGVLYLHGGWVSMVDELEKRAREGGVEIVRGCEVSNVYRVEETHALTVAFKNSTGANEQKTFDGIILAVPPEAVKKVVGSSSLSEGQKALTLGIKPLTDIRAACLDICLKKLPNPSATFALGIDESLYYSVHSAAANLTPAGGALVHVAYYLKEGEVGTHKIEQRLEKLMDNVQPGWRTELVYKRYLPNIAVAHKLLEVHDGKVGGFWSEETAESGVYFAGDWVGKHHLVDASLGSAKRASELLLEELSNRASERPLVNA